MIRLLRLNFMHGLAGAYTIQWVGVDVGAIVQSYAGLARTITYQPPNNLFPGGRTNTETIILNEPGSLYYPRYNQVDLNLKKNLARRRDDDPAGPADQAGVSDEVLIVGGSASRARPPYFHS